MCYFIIHIHIFTLREPLTKQAAHVMISEIHSLFDFEGVFSTTERLDLACKTKQYVVKSATREEFKLEIKHDKIRNIVSFCTDLHLNLLWIEHHVL